MKKIYITDEKVRWYVLELIRKFTIENVQFDFVVGLSRGGLIPAVLLSHFFDKPFYALNKPYDTELPSTGRALIVDDINDTGKTFARVDELLFEKYPDLIKIYVSLIENTSSPFAVDYCADEINKDDDPSWIVFPWENWWSA
jgi:hypoxanthine phosphoribosyltransferase